MLILLVAAILLLIIFAILSLNPMPHVVNKLALPLGGRDRDVVHRQYSGNSRLVVYLQGNCMNPSHAPPNFNERGWDCVSVGYTDTLIGSITRVCDIASAESEKYDDVGVWSRSIGTVMAADVARAVGASWVVYETPISSISELVGPVGSTIQSYLPCVELRLGMSEQLPEVPYHMLLAGQDRVTPPKLVARFQEGAASVHVSPNAGHNDLAGTEAWHNTFDLVCPRP